MPSKDGRIDIHDFVSPDRRTLIKSLGAAATSVFLGDAALATGALAAAKFSSDPFTLGVASGDPAVDGFVIWTRLAPEPLKAGGGMPSAAVHVTWEIASDDHMRSIVRSGSMLARPERAHAVHVEVAGLKAGSEYFYHFTAAGIRSPVGRGKTLPQPGSVDPVRFVSAGCQRYEDGYFTAWRRIAEDRPDFVAHYGDYIYEYKAPTPGEDRRFPLVRSMPGMPGTCITLEDFRNRYAIYKLDPDLQAAHAAAPFLPSFDDHEVENNWAGYHSANPKTTREALRLRRVAAFQAWYEHMPLRAAQLPRGPDILAHRRIQVGALLQINVLDTRQHRSAQPCGGDWKVCPEAKAADRTMLGKAQEDWLRAGFGARQKSTWTVLAQQVPVGRFDRNPDPAVTEVNMDKWDGAEAARTRLFDAAAAARVRNLVVLSGDVHQNRANELRRNFDEPASPAIGVEFVATSIASNGDGVDQPKNASDIRGANPHLKYFNTQRGFVRHTVSAKTWAADYVTLDKVSEQGASATTRAKLVVENGKSQLARA